MMRDKAILDIVSAQSKAMEELKSHLRELKEEIKALQARINFLEFDVKTAKLLVRSGSWLLGLFLVIELIMGVYLSFKGADSSSVLNEIRKEVQKK